MKALQFETRLGRDRVLTVPADVAAQVPDGQQVRVILVLDEAGDDDPWPAVTAEQFLAGYDEADAIYDQLPPR